MLVEVDSSFDSVSLPFSERVPVVRPQRRSDYYLFLALLFPKTGVQPFRRDRKLALGG